ncbi:bifunctional phosphopantothenoylcysteine decarboxylase/phosphopantothenate--cysteine ligase CoaBC [Chthonobacter albigriseus]|uniref:bifunctional phosphopantothenoylcysteine decarboxylase/phosphopantothenate--cysteine ligase CoaBC n=1 Tax=Chthonobacter albigriseus TaxID=1683161 RepID=UPI0015EFCBEE|nr:bifunctional phosphopantothenoylcysteine decarboxylase/phosphopantothenate--cysteine ligase CoaBC [Chthonobacter albigriseus]
MLEKKRILLIIGGGIAAYKVLDLIRRLKERGATVRAILTKAGAEFVTPLSVGTLTEERVHTDLFDLTDEHEIGHIRLSREADLVLVAPATADLLAKMANGLANDLASTCLLATTAPVMVCPAMNPRMWSHPATVRNVARLKADGATVVEPAAGRMAERGEEGVGRLPEPLEIVAEVERFFQAAAAPKPLAGRRMVVTSGPTHEPIDPVRYIANRSSGRQGHAIAAAAARAGADVVLVSGPVSLPHPPGVRVVRVETARQMLAAVEAALPADIAVLAAAVADWRTADAADRKIKKDGSGTPPALALTENPDILKTVGHLGAARPTLVVGFAAETDDVEANARGKLTRKNADLIVANDVSPGTGVMGGTENTVIVIDRAGVTRWPKLAKEAVAERLVALFAERLAGGRP